MSEIIHAHTAERGLSVLIPAYNRDCTHLVATLCCQIDAMQGSDGTRPTDRSSTGARPLRCEIIIADDGSTDSSALAANRQMGDWRHCTYIERGHNVGRATIRNALTAMAKYSHLLFLDCDVEISKRDFISSYLAMLDEADVVIGSLHFTDGDGHYRHNLRYVYERKFLESHPIAVRMKRPYASFRTTNFVARKEVMLSHPFDESFVEYGYEDTLFGKILEKAGVSIKHTDNYVDIADYDTNATFMAKTEQSLRTLSAHADEIGEASKVLSAYTALERAHMLPITRLMFALTRTLIRKGATCRRPSLLCYTAYKLGYFISIHKSR